MITLQDTETVFRVARKYNLALINHDSQPEDQLVTKILAELLCQGVAQREAEKITEFLIQFAYPKSVATGILGLKTV